MQQESGSLWTQVSSLSSVSICNIGMLRLISYYVEHCFSCWRGSRTYQKLRMSSARMHSYKGLGGIVVPTSDENDVNQIVNRFNFLMVICLPVCAGCYSLSGGADRSWLGKLRSSC